MDMRPTRLCRRLWTAAMCHHRYRLYQGATSCRDALGQDGEGRRNRRSRMNDLPPILGVPSEPDLAAERAREERAERWLLLRQVAIIFVLVTLILAHALLG